MPAGAPDPFDYDPATVPAGALFVAADEPLLVFPSVLAGERALEIEDVEDGLYPIAYGPHGEVYRIGFASRRVTVERSGEADRPEDLKALLLRALEADGRPADRSMPLPDLVSQIWTREAEFWREHDPDGDRFGTPIPLWGCALGIVGVAGIAYVILH